MIVFFLLCWVYWQVHKASYLSLIPWFLFIAFPFYASGKFHISAEMPHIFMLISIFLTRCYNLSIIVISDFLPRNYNNWSISRSGFQCTLLKNVSYLVHSLLQRQADFLSLPLWHLSCIGGSHVWGSFLSLSQLRSFALYHLRILGISWFSALFLEAGGFYLSSVQGMGKTRFPLFPSVVAELFLEWVRWQVVVVEHLLLIPQWSLAFIKVLESGPPRHKVGFMFVPQGQPFTTFYLGRAQSRDHLQIYPLNPQLWQTLETCTTKRRSLSSSELSLSFHSTQWKPTENNWQSCVNTHWSMATSDSKVSWQPTLSLEYLLKFFTAFMAATFLPMLCQRWSRVCVPSFHRNGASHLFRI